MKKNPLDLESNSSEEILRVTSNEFILKAPPHLLGSSAYKFELLNNLKI